MIQWLIAWSLRNRFLVACGVLVALLAIVGKVEICAFHAPAPHPVVLLFVSLMGALGGPSYIYSQLSIDKPWEPSAAGAPAPSPAAP